MFFVAGKNGGNFILSASSGRLYFQVVFGFYKADVGFLQNSVVGTVQTGQLCSAGSVLKKVKTKVQCQNQGRV